MLDKEDALFSDQLNHASIIDGVRLAKCRKFRYKHQGTCMCSGVLDCMLSIHLLMSFVLTQL